MKTAAMQWLERFLDLSAYRQGIITGNIANIDTPGYRTRDINFRAELTRAMTSPGERLTPGAANVGGLVQRPDGNDVSLDRESLELAKTQLQFRMGVQLLRRELMFIRTAINEGRTI